MPFADLRYLIGEIFYGGHITDPWDRVTCNTYLEVLFNEELMASTLLAPKLRSPEPNETDFKEYAMFIDKGLPSESPLLFGLHPNAEISSLSAQTDATFGTIAKLSGGGGGGGSGGGGASVRSIAEKLFEAVPKALDMIDINERAKPRLRMEGSPYVTTTLTTTATTLTTTTTTHFLTPRLSQVHRRGVPGGHPAECPPRGRVHVALGHRQVLCRHAQRHSANGGLHGRPRCGRGARSEHLLLLQLGEARVAVA